MNRMVLPSTQEQRAHFQVNRAGAVEAIFQPLYDTLTYDGSAGQTVLRFFAQPQGQGGKTLADTNMTLSGQLPNMQTFEIRYIEVNFLPGVDLSAFGAQDSLDYLNDVQDFANNGYLELNIGSKNYLTDGPLGQFPATTGLNVAAAFADATTAGANLQSRAGYARVIGQRYDVTPMVLPSNQNFDVTMRWPTAVPLASEQDARVQVRLGGILYRNSQ